MVRRSVPSASWTQPRHVPIALLATLFAIAALLALLAFVAVPGRQPTSALRYGDVLLIDSPGGLRVALLFALAGVSLFVAGLTAWLGTSDVLLAALTFGLAATWMAPELVGWEQGPPVVRALAYLLAPLFLPLSVLVPIRALGVRPGRLGRGVLAALVCGVTCLAVLRALTYDPLLDLDCVRGCDYGVLAWVRAVSIARFITSLLGILAIGVGLGGVAWASARWVRLPSIQRRTQGWVLGSSVALGASIALWAMVRVAVPHEAPDDVRFLVPAVLTALALAGMGIAICDRLAQVMRRRSAVRRIADRLDDETVDGAGMTAVLARTIGDARVAVAFPSLDGTGYVDELGRDVPEPRWTAGRAVTVVERGGSRVALVSHEADIGSQLLSREIGAAARLTVENARLTALVRARVRELRESRARIVDTGDRARQALERDLHDGAQQSSLAVSFELRMARDAASAAGAMPADLATYDEAIDQVDQALTELRDLARGIHPVVLTDEGLQSALVSLADRASTILLVTGQWACGDETTAIAAYQVVAEAVVRAEAAGAPRVEVDLQRTAAGMAVVVTSADLGDASWLHAEDRVGAAGGTLRLEADEGPVVRVEVELPCA